MDRFTPSNIVYGKVLRNLTESQLDVYRNKEVSLADTIDLLVYVYASNKELLKRLDKRKDDLVNSKHISKLNSAYEDYLETTPYRYVKIDTTNRTPKECANALYQYVEELERTLELKDAPVVIPSKGKITRELTHVFTKYNISDLNFNSLKLDEDQEFYLKILSENEDFIVSEFKENKYTRRAVVSFFDTEHLSCMVSCQFSLRENKLDCFINFRSSDVAKFRKDVYVIYLFYANLLLKIKEVHNVEAGKFYVYQDSFHSYNMKDAGKEC